MSLDWQTELRRAERAALAAGELLKAAMAGEKKILAEPGRDIKLQADQDAEAVVLGALAGSAFEVLAEESGESEGLDPSKPFWIVDPLDGTFNFSRRLPFCAVSIALATVDTPMLGVVYDFNRGDLYSGAVGHGAWLNGAPMHVSKITETSRAVLTAGFPVNFVYEDDSLMVFAQMARSFRKLRMFGSAALSLAYVAAGLADAYAEDDIMYWDVAAGLALVRAAGGYVACEDTRRLKWARRVRCAASPQIWGAA